MSEQKVPYLGKEPNPSGIPAHLLRFLYRFAKLEPGRHLVVIDVPDKAEREPTWTFLGNGPIENQR
jgi:hypothetical protein